GHRLLDVVLDVLREVEIDADELALELFAHLFDHGDLGQTLGPFFRRLQLRKQFGNEGAIGISALVTAALFGDHGAYRSIARNHTSHSRDGVRAGFERYRRRQQRANPQVSLFQLGQEFGAEPDAERRATHQESESQCRRKPEAADGKWQDDAIGLANLP